MTLMAAGLLAFTIAALAAHLVSAVLVARRARVAGADGAHFDPPPVTLVRPVCGLDDIERLALASSFALTASNVELIFCCARDDDPAVDHLRNLIARHPAHDARIVTGTALHTVNPKLDNMAQAWPLATAPWIIFADSNLVLPPDYIERVLSRWDARTGLVSAPPIGAAPVGLPGEVECAFLNTYQARWQYAADAVGFGFAQGKTLAWRRADLQEAGGIAALSVEPAEDAASTRIVRAAGRRVRLAGPAFVQPIGRRTWRQVLRRQTRWAQLRRATFPAFYVPEVLSGSVLPIAAGALAGAELAGSPLAGGAAVAAVFLGTEAALARTAGWHLSWSSPLAWLIRDALIPYVWAQGWMRANYEWRGNAISAEAPAGGDPHSHDALGGMGVGR